MHRRLMVAWVVYIVYGLLSIWMDQRYLAELSAIRSELDKSRAFLSVACDSKDSLMPSVACRDTKRIVEAWDEPIMKQVAMDNACSIFGRWCVSVFRTAHVLVPIVFGITFLMYSGRGAV